jgi:hypothetical protein
VDDAELRAQLDAIAADGPDRGAVDAGIARRRAVRARRRGFVAVGAAVCAVAVIAGGIGFLAGGSSAPPDRQGPASSPTRSVVKSTGSSDVTEQCASWQGYPLSTGGTYVRFPTAEPPSVVTSSSPRPSPTVSMVECTSPPRLSSPPPTSLQESDLSGASAAGTSAR